MRAAAPLLVALALGTAGEAAAMGRLLITGEREFARCRIQQIQARYDGPEHRYTGSGHCTLFVEHTSSTDPRGTSEFGNERVIGERPWTLDGRYDARTGRTSERITLPVRQTDKFKVSGVVQLVLQCAGDPWLDERITACASPQVSTTGQVDTIRPALLRSMPVLPYTAEGAGAQRRAAFRAAHASAAALARATGGSLRDRSPTRSSLAAGAATATAGGTRLDASAARAGAELRSPAAGALRAPSTLGAHPTVERAPATTVQVAGDGDAAVAPATAAAIPLSTPSTPVVTKPKAPAGAASAAAARQARVGLPLPPPGRAAAARDDAARRGLNPQPLPPQDAPPSAFSRRLAP